MLIPTVALVAMIVLVAVFVGVQSKKKTLAISS